MRFHYRNKHSKLFKEDLKKIRWSCLLSQNYPEIEIKNFAKRKKKKKERFQGIPFINFVEINRFVIRRNFFFKNLSQDRINYRSNNNPNKNSPR